MAPIQTIPAVIVVIILESVDSAIDIQSFLLAFPTTRPLFNLYQTTILRASLFKLRSTLGTDLLFSTALLAGRLRSLRNKNASRSPIELLEMLHPLLDSLKDPADYPDDSQYTDLETLCATTQVVLDGENVMTGFASWVWERLKIGFRGYYPRLPEWKREKVRRLPLELSQTDGEKLFDAMFKLESHCCAFYYGRSRLSIWQVPAMGSSPQTFPSGENGPVHLHYGWNGYGMIDSKVGWMPILSHLKGRHTLLFQRASQAVDQQKSHPYIGPGKLLGLLKTWFRHRNLNDEKQYRHHVLPQGLQLLLEPERMDSQQVEKFVVKTLFRVSLIGDASYSLSGGIAGPERALGRWLDSRR
ncbi:hypothetical protein ACJZ2D_004815 [Fusarium nematophilum]